MRTKPSVLLIGNGRLAKHLHFWNSTLQEPLPLHHWHRGQSDDQLQAALKLADLVWLCVSDAAIVPFFEKVLISSKSTIVHFSGAIHHPKMIGAHPLMTFPDALFTADTYRKIHYVLSGTENLSEALPGFSNSFSVISGELRPYYHALCVVAGNFPQFLWRDVAHGMQKMNIPDHALEVYLRQVTENFIKLKENSLTGPLVRRDEITIAKNISALQEIPHLQKIYSVFAQEYCR